jgi:peroxiredoxin
MRFKHIFLFFVLLSSVLRSQTLRIELPFHTGKELKLSVRRAVTSDTIMQQKLDENGVTVFHFAEKQRRTGLATMTIKPDVNYEFVLSPRENPVISSKEQFVNPGNTTIAQSPENRSIDSLFSRLMIFKQKQEVLRPLTQIYPATDSFGIEARIEQKRIEKAFSQFNDSLKSNTSYGAQFIEVRQLVNEAIENAWQSDSLKTVVRNYVLNKLDINFVYGSGMYFNLFNGLNMYVYPKESIYHQEFGNDMVLVLQKTESLEIFTTLATDLLTICEKLSWDKEAEKIVDYLIDSKRILNPGHRLQMFLTQHGVREGKPAPPISITNQVYPQTDISFRKAKKGTILFFYETGCDYCEKELTKLVANTPLLEEKGIRIVSISSDADKDIFGKSAQKLPWKDKLCDLKGVGGPNFQSYGVMGTPTIYYVDNQGIIRVRTARLEEVLKSCL